MKCKKITTAAISLLVLTLGFTGCGTAGTNSSFSSGSGSDLSADQILTGMYENGISCHDPQIILADDTYYMTGSHMVLAKSENLNDWDYVANGSPTKYISNLYDGSLPAFSYVGKNEDGGYSVWAGNIYYNETMEKYMLYFCTSSTYIKSALALAVSDTPDGPYEYVGDLLYSGFTKSEVDQTDLMEVLGEGADTSRYFKYGAYNNEEWPNCIDPAVFTDEEGKMWMVYGSWSGGIFMLELDPTTGFPIHPETDEENDVDAYFGYHLIGGGHHACEGPYITYNEENGYYYLFVSYGELTREGGYQMRQYRSESPTGPYYDASGKTWDDEEDYFSYGLKMAGNYTLPSLDGSYMAPGGQSVFTGADGNTYITYHQRFDEGTEYHEPRVHQLYLTEDDWYVMAPFETSDESYIEGGVTKDTLSGTFYILNHGTDVSSVIEHTETYEFSDGKIKGDTEGSYEFKEGENYISVILGDQTYNGTVIQMTDEAGNHTICFMAVSDNNETIWGVRYINEQPDRGIKEIICLNQ